MFETALVARLSTLAPNLYPLEAPKNYPTPAVVYSRLQTKAVQDLSRTYGGAWVHLQVSVYDPQYLDAIALAEQLRDTIIGWNDQDVLSVTWDNEQHLVDTTTETTLYHVGLRFFVLLNLTVPAPPVTAPTASSAPSTP